MNVCTAADEGNAELLPQAHCRTRANACRASGLTVVHLLGHASTQILPTHVKPLDENTKAVIEGLDLARVSDATRGSNCMGVFFCMSFPAAQFGELLARLPKWALSLEYEYHMGSVYLTKLNFLRLTKCSRTFGELLRKRSFFRSCVRW